MEALAPNMLPRSGIGTQGPLLIIAPPGNPAIQLDARLLDRVETAAVSPGSRFAVTGVATVAAIASAAMQFPGWLLVTAGMGVWAQDRLRSGLRASRSKDLVLKLGAMSVRVQVADGPAAAQKVADYLAPYTREAPITRPEVYQDAKRRLQAQAQGRHDAALREIRGTLKVGDDVVEVDGERIVIGGARSFPIADVRSFARRGENLTLPGGQVVQAALAMLMVAAEQRAQAGEDLDRLSKRVRDYEEWSGRSAGR